MKELPGSGTDGTGLPPKVDVQAGNEARARVHTYTVAAGFAHVNSR
jgi:hypothetical protein